MVDSPNETDSLGDPPDDGQLTIRIPNPKVYMARQSQWKGRRGKPRCDHCRMNNLKCDRVIPTCNHCSWASGRECKYTPLPTPAHRGIPRCDRCRQKNSKCDRSLPVCNHCSEENETECNYTPKKRHKVPSDHTLARDRQMQNYGAKTASFLVSNMPSMDDQIIISGPDIPESSGKHSFYGHNVASSSHTYYSPSPTGYERDGSSELESPINGHSSHHRSPGHPGRPWTSDSPAHLGTKSHTFNHQFSFISHAFSPEQGATILKQHVEPWSQSPFVPLPDPILQRISVINSVEMPGRHTFDESLATFLGNLTQDIRETATLNADIYATIAHGITKGDLSGISDRIRLWTSYHHVRSGSNKSHLLVIPRDPFFDIKSSEEEKLRAEYVARIDSKSSITSGGSSHAADLSASAGAKAFERIPVQNQIYDILVYAHRSHGSSSAMLIEIRRIGMSQITWPMVEIFIRLCPLCNLRGKTGSAHLVKAESTSFGTFDSAQVGRVD